MNYLDSLNEMQRKAVLATEGPILMLAGAGSGKTRALTCRIARLVEMGVSPWSILAITFTNKAAREMRERVNELVLDGAKSIFISTFHSACVRFLRSDIENLGSTYTKNFTIYDSDDQRSVIKECIMRLNIDDKTFKPGMLLSRISEQKDNLTGCAEYERKAKGDFYKETISRVYTLYQSLLKKNNALDFDDLIFLTVKLLKENSSVLDKYQERFKYILVDEYQDTNTAQYELAKLLASRLNNICVVGDDDQSIYGWRGANIQNIYNFEKDFQNASVIKLEQNYRSTKNILNAANGVIIKNCGRKSKSLWTENNDGAKIKHYAAENEREEALFIAKEILKMSRPYKDFSILYRTNAQSRVLEEMLIKKNVPYRIFGGLRFYERKEIKDILSYLRLIVNPDDDISARRVVNVPKRGAGKAFIDKITNYADENEISFFEALRKTADDGSAKMTAKIKDFPQMISSLAEMSENAGVVELINELLSQTEYIKMLESEGDEFESNSRIENVNEFISKAEEFEKSGEGGGLSAFLSEVSLVADIDNYSEADDAVILMTIHSAKGLEFPVVFLSGLEDGLFPGYMSISAGEKQLEEERRLFYVGVTRAREHLYFTRAKSRMVRGFTEYLSASRFIKETPQDLIEIVKDAEYTTPPRERPSAKKQEYSVSAATFESCVKPPVNSVNIDFEVGDCVLHKKFGVGKVTSISPAGKDYEVTVEFQEAGKKKLMAALSGIKKTGGTP